MKKETQNLLWDCLPNETKEEVRKKYKKYRLYNKSVLDYIFGKHNLISISKSKKL